MDSQINNSRHQTAFYGVLLLIILIPLFSLGLSNHGLWTADEPRVAEIGREMALTGNWIVPTLNQRPFLEHPPLYYASLAAVFKVCGVVSDKVARIPAAIYACAGCIALFFLASLIWGPRTGFISAIILATSFEYFRVAHWLVVDSALAAFVIIALTCFVAGYRSNSGRQRFLYYVFFYVACGFAFFTKGFMGVVIPGLAVITFLIFERNIKELLHMHLWLGICIFLVMTLPWFFGLWKHGGAEHLNTFLIYNHLQRFLPGGASGHHQPFYFYLTGLPAGFLPWSIILLPALYFSFWKGIGTSAEDKRDLLFFKCWLAAGFIFLSFASTKRILYLLPVFAPCAVLTARYIDTTISSRLLKKTEKPFLILFVLFPLIIGIIIIPAYLYFFRKYALELSDVSSFSLTIASILITVFSIVSLRYFFKNHAGPFWAWSSGAIIAVLIFALTTVIPVVDQFKSFVPFCRQVKMLVPSNVQLFGYKPDETLRGAVPFYTGYYFTETDSKNYLIEKAKRGNQVFVLIRDNRGRLEDELLSTGQFIIIFRQGAKTDRSLVLLTNKS